MNGKTQKLTLSAIMIALGTVLSLVRLFEMPYGGSVTPFSMVPIMLCAYLFGIRWGLFCGTVYGALQAILGATMSGAFIGQNFFGVIAVLMLDYLVAFAVLGFAGVFVDKLKKPALSFSLGCLLASFLRFTVHFVSGVIIWGSYAESTLQGLNDSLSRAILNNLTGTGLAAAYSLVYNASFMLPETLISLVAVLALAGVGPIKAAVKAKSDKV
jgi:thiamine transporter